MALGFSTVGESELDTPEFGGRRGYENLDSLSNKNPVNVYGIPVGHPHYGFLHRGMTTPPGPSYATVDITNAPAASWASELGQPSISGKSFDAWDSDEPDGGGELLPWEALAKQMQGDYWMGGYGYNPLPKRRSLPYMDAFTNAFVTWPKGEGSEFQRRMLESDV